MCSSDLMHRCHSRFPCSSKHSHPRQVSHSMRLNDAYLPWNRLRNPSRQSLDCMACACNRRTGAGFQPTLITRTTSSNIQMLEKQMKSPAPPPWCCTAGSGKIDGTFGEKVSKKCHSGKIEGTFGEKLLFSGCFKFFPHDGCTTTSRRLHDAKIGRAHV
mgnify:CR=1 FL=1